MGNRTSATTSVAGAGIEIDGSGNALPLGHRLQEYVIEGLIGEGGFGIVYLARDTQLGRVVALKEYMPSSLATRDGEHQVSVRSMRHRETFELGLRSFVNEAQLLASFDHPSLVKVYRFWEQNGTAYMVMPYYQGPTLKQWLVENGARADEGWLLSLLHPVIDALEVMHHERCYHRDIAPDNILLLQHASTQIGRPHAVRPVLLDFGAARRVISDATQALTVILKSGYAPIEQYAESTSMKQGAWTDVYALSAVLYAAITGKAPLPSVSRMVTDDMVPAAQAGAGHYTQEFLAAIDKGLSVRPEHRPQDMAALRQLFSYGTGTPSTVPAAVPPAPAADATLADDGATVVLGPATAAPAVTVQVPRPSPPPPAPPVPSASPAPAAAPRPAAPVPPIKLLNPEPAPAPSRTGLWVASGLALSALAAAGWWFGLRDSAPPAPPATDPGTTASPAVARSEPPAPPASAAAAPPPPAVAATPFGIVPALQDIVRQADPLLGVNALADKSAIVIGKDRLQFRVKASQSGYVYVFLGGTDKGHMYLLFPNAIDRDNRIDANKELQLPRKGWQITAGGPPGTNHIVTMVSRLPRDFSQAGLRASKDDIPEFDLARAEQLWAARTGRDNPFVGQAVCPPQGACDATYGATLLTIDEVR
ncbi:MAG: protein kinase [Rhizobacter sp.]|nr:protein kinase [Rhizobacter sp.]